MSTLDERLTSFALAVKAKFAALQATGGAQYASRTALAAVTAPLSGTAAYLSEAGREGQFVFSTASGDATLAALDTYQGIYIAGSGGTWVRKFAGAVHAAWFGVADGASNNAARIESIETIFWPYAKQIIGPDTTATGKLDFDRGLKLKRPHRLVWQGWGTDDSTINNDQGVGPSVIRFPYGCGKGIGLLGGPGDGLAGSSGAQRASISDVRIEFYGSIPSGGTFSYNPAFPNTINVLSGSANFSNGQFIAGEGGGKSTTVQDRTVAMSIGSNTATVTETVVLGIGLGNPSVYTGQHITVAGAGVAGADLVGYVGTWGPTSFTVVDAAGAALNASTNVAAAVYRVRECLWGEIVSGGGTATLTITTPYQVQSITGGVLRHMDCGIHAECTVILENVEANVGGSAGLLSRGGGCDFFFYGMGVDPNTGRNSNADNSIIRGCKGGGNQSFASVICYGTDGGNASEFSALNVAGPKVGLLDHSFLGFHVSGIHCSSNVGVVVALPNSVTHLDGGYVGEGASYRAPAGASCSFDGTLGMYNASGWEGIDKSSSGGFVLPPFVSGRHTCSEDVLVGRALKGSSGTGMARFVGTGANYPLGSLTTGISLYYNSGRNSGVVKADDGTNNQPLELVGSKVQARPGDVATGEWDNSLGGLNLLSGKALFNNGTQVLGARQTGWTAPTGTPTRSTFVTSTVTLSVLAEHVKALIDDLTTHGVIGT